MTTDGFLHPNAELERRGLMRRKGFPESYDRRALLRFVADIKAGKPEVPAPVYSHLVYDVLDEQRVVSRPDILVLEGLNVLQPAPATGERASALAVSDLIDFSVYVDAHPSDVRRWYVERFLALRETAFRDPASYFRRYAEMDETDARGPGRDPLGRDQRAEPAGEHRAHPLAGRPRADQGRRPLGAPDPAARL